MKSRRELCRYLGKEHPKRREQQGQHLQDRELLGKLEGQQGPCARAEGVRGRAVWNEDREAVKREIRKDSVGLGQEFA